MWKQIAVFLVWTMLVLSIPMVTGCSQSQTQVVENVVAQLINGKPLLSQLQQLATDFRSLDPALLDEIKEYAKLASDNVDSLVTVGNAYLALPSASSYQAILNGVDALTASVDKKLLEAAKITNADTQKKILLTLGLLATGMHIVNALLLSHAKLTQLRAMPEKSADRVPFDEIKQYLSRGYAKERLSAMGYDAGTVLQAAGF